MIPHSLIISAQDNLIRSGVVLHTPLEYSKRLSEKYWAQIFQKREDLQPVRSYKIRGAYNTISSLSHEEQAKWVICASAGNHAQGFAYSCSHLHIHGIVYMPRTTPEQKVYKTRKFWGEWIEIVLDGDTFDDAYEGARQCAVETGRIFIHPFDDERVIAGQGTVGLEILEDLRKIDIIPDMILCPVWWWWLVSGIISAVNPDFPEAEIIWIETEGATALATSLREKKNTTLETIDTFADWVAVRRVWDIPFSICQEYNLPVELVPENRLCSTMLEYLREDGIVLEPAWALTTDALKNFSPERIMGKAIVLVLSGSNFDFDRLPDVKERSMKYEWKKKYLLVTFPQRPWALKEFLSYLGPDDDIVRFEYLKKTNKERAPALIGIECQSDSPQFHELYTKLQQANIIFQDLTENQLLFDLLI